MNKHNNLNFKCDIEKDDGITFEVTKQNRLDIVIEGITTERQEILLDKNDAKILMYWLLRKYGTVTDKVLYE